MTWYETIKIALMSLGLMCAVFTVYRLYSDDRDRRAEMARARREATSVNTEAWMALWRDEKRARLYDRQVSEQRIARLEAELKKSEERLAALSSINDRLWDQKKGGRR